MRKSLVVGVNDHADDDWRMSRARCDRSQSAALFSLLFFEDSRLETHTKSAVQTPLDSRVFSPEKQKTSSLTIWKIKFDETKRKKAGREISCAVLNWNVHHTIKFDRQNVFCFCFFLLRWSLMNFPYIRSLLLVYIVCGVPRVIPRLRKKLSSFSYYFQALFLFTSATQRTPSKPAKWWTHRSLRRITIIAKKEVRKKEHRGEGGKRVLETLFLVFSYTSKADDDETSLSLFFKCMKLGQKFQNLPIECVELAFHHRPTDRRRRSSCRL